MIARLCVEAAGPLTTVQDAGRIGAMRFGVPRSGPIDRLAFAAAIAAASADGGPGQGTAIELSLGGLTLTCREGPIGFALCGDGFAAEIDGRLLGGWCRALLCTGEQLRVRSGGGNWGYLAFSGSADAAPWLGSRATHALSGLGGGAVRQGDALMFQDVQTLPPAGLEAPAPLPPDSPIGLIIGPQERYFAEDAVEQLCAAMFVASARFDRMGRALEGPLLVPRRLDMPSEPAARGCLQIAGDGRMTMLLADHQTTGGYPKIAAVISADIDRVARLPVGTAFRFEAVSAEAAVQRLRALTEQRADYLRDFMAGGTLVERLSGRNLVGGVIDALDAG